MAFETKEEVFERVILQKRPLCKYCQQEMSIWEAPDMVIDDGLGWGTPYMFVCFNDACRLYAQGWDNIRENYGRTASYRCICYPGTENFECMSVYGPQGGHGQIIEEEALARQKEIEARIGKGLSTLEACAGESGGETALRILMDADEPMRVRVKAAEILGELGRSDAVEPLKNKKFGNDILRKRAAEAVDRIHERHFTRECPFCAEIVKKRAKICKHCGRELTE
ncbi:zinc ribbon domain-containing protein [Desulfococcus sp.]|uniref:zinc ribbon domain-containing protein n=1 Tax=Desulfococcus sp. TaxID=2025834 RepID=UPI0035941038